MPGEKISQLPPATLPMAGSEWMECVQNGDSCKVPVSALPGGGGGSSNANALLISNGTVIGPGLTGSQAQARQAIQATLATTPQITSLSETFGSPGDTILITGSAFYGVQSVSFNGVAAASFSLIRDTSISAVVPASCPNGPITVTTPLGSATSVSSLTIQLPASIARISPEQAAPGQLVTLWGQRLSNVTAIQIGAISCPNFTILNDFAITVTVPASIVTAVASVTNPYGSVSSTQSLTAIAAPTISSFSPGSGAAASVIDVFGSGFLAGVLATYVSGAACAFTVLSDTHLQLTLGNTFTGTINVVTMGGSAISATALTVTGSGSAPLLEYVGFTTSSGGNFTWGINGQSLGSITAVYWNGTLVSSLVTGLRAAAVCQ